MRAAIEAFVAQQSFYGLARQLHELPAHTRAHRRQLDGRPARIPEEGDFVDAVILDPRVDDKPALDIGRPDEARADRFASRARSAIAGDDELRAQAAFAGGRGDLQVDAGLAWGDGRDFMREQPAHGREAM